MPSGTAPAGRGNPSLPTILHLSSLRELRCKIFRARLEHSLSEARAVLACCLTMGVGSQSTHGRAGQVTVSLEQRN